MGVLSANKRRGTEAVGDMLRSLLVVLAVILVVGVYFLFARPHPNPVRVVESGPQLQAARSAASYHVLAPVGLGSGWRLTSARDDIAKGGEPVALHLGYVTPQGHYAALDESDARPADVVSAQLGDRATYLGRTTIAGVPWQRWRGAGSDTGLVRQASGATVVVHGDAPAAELATLAAALR